jgi:RNA polymerase sigma-70 factor (ECF subfamily)
MDVLRRFALGDIDAFETLVRKHQGDVYAWIVRMVRDPGIAEDLTVEALWRIYQARHRFRPDGNFAAWARRIATNLALDHLRRKPWRQGPLTEEPAVAPVPDPVLQQQTRARIEQAFCRLPVKLRVAATLALVEQQPYDQIAEALGTSVGAVKLRVFRAVRILREQLIHLGVRP